MIKKLFALLLSFALLVCLMFSGCSNKTVFSDDIENDEVGLFEEMSAVIEAKQNEFEKLNFNRLSADASLEVELGEAFSDFGAEVSGNRSFKNLIDELGLDSAKIQANLDRNSDVLQISGAGLVNDTNIVNGDLAVDLKNKMLYFALPGFTEEVLAYDFSEYFEDEDLDTLWENFSSIYESELAFNNEISGIISDEELISLLSEYFDCGLAALDKPESGNTVLTVDNVSQTVEYKKYTIDAEGLVDFAKAVLTKLSNDENVRAKFLELYPVVIDYYMIEMYNSYSYYGYDDYYSDIPSAEEVYDEMFIPEVKKLLQEIENEDTGDFDIDEKFYFEQYFVNGEFVGFEYSISQDDGLAAYFIEDGGSSALILNVFGVDSTDASIKLVGKTVNDVYNGVFTVKAESYSYYYGDEATEFSVGIENVNLNKLRKGIINGTIVFDEELMATLSDNALPEGVSMKISLESDNCYYAKISANLEYNKKLVVRASLNCEISDDADNITIPGNYVLVEDEDDIEVWAEDVAANAFSVIYSRLQESGMSDSFLSMLALMGM